MEKTTAKRITKAMRYEDIKSLLAGEKPVNGTSVDEALDFIDAQMELLARKNSGDKKPTKVQEENEKLKGLILDFLSIQTTPVTCTDIYKGVPDFMEGGYMVNKTTTLLSQLDKAGLIKREKVKGRPMFSAMQ